MFNAKLPIVLKSFVRSNPIVKLRYTLYILVIVAKTPD